MLLCIAILASTQDRRAEQPWLQARENVYHMQALKDLGFIDHFRVLAIGDDLPLCGLTYSLLGCPTAATPG